MKGKKEVQAYDRLCLFLKAALLVCDPVEDRVLLLRRKRW